MLQVLNTGAIAQPVADTVIIPDNSADTGKVSVHSLYAGAGYGSNMIYLGTTMSQDNSFGYTSFSYGFRNKLYLTATGYTINGFSPFIGFSSLGVSFSHTFNSWFDISTGLSRYNVAESLRDTLFSNFTYADATLGIDWRLLYTKISLGGLFADGGQFYFQTRHSRYFETPSFAGGKAFFSFDPYVNVNKIAIVLVIQCVTPYMLVELMTCQHLVLVDHQIVKEIKFLLCNLYLTALVYDLSCLGRDDELSQGYVW